MRRTLEALDQPAEQVEAIDALWRAIDVLPVDLKMALLLRDVVGLSYNEIADSLEITLATVKWRIFKAREDVQVALAREGITFGRSQSRVGCRRRRLDAESQMPCASRAASADGRPRSRISACVCSIGYGDSPEVARAASVSISSQAARGSPSRGWPTEPGLSSQRPRRGRRSVPAGASAARRALRRPSASASATWLWPTSTSGAVVSSRLSSAAVLAEHVVPHRVARAAVEELDAVGARRRLEAAEPGALRLAEHALRPDAPPPPRRR